MKLVMMNDDGVGTVYEIGSMLFDLLYNDLGLEPKEALQGLAVVAVAMCHKTDNPQAAMIEFTDLIDDSTLEIVQQHIEGLGTYES